MSMEEAILDKVRRLTPARQAQVLRFAGGLENPVVRMLPALRSQSSLVREPTEWS
jgi:hypothetical protein